MYGHTAAPDNLRLLGCEGRLQKLPVFQVSGQQTIGILVLTTQETQSQQCENISRNTHCASTWTTHLGFPRWPSDSCTHVFMSLFLCQVRGREGKSSSAKLCKEAKVLQAAALRTKGNQPFGMCFSGNNQGPPLVVSGCLEIARAACNASSALKSVLIWLLASCFCLLTYDS